jgi:hypothetical protein
MKTPNQIIQNFIKKYEQRTPKMRTVDIDEIVTVAESVSQTLESKLGEGAILLPQLINAAINIYLWLAKDNRIDEEETQSRNILQEQLIAEMKKRLS